MKSVGRFPPHNRREPHAISFICHQNTQKENLSLCVLSVRSSSFCWSERFFVCLRHLLATEQGWRVEKVLVECLSSVFSAEMLGSLIHIELSSQTCCGPQDFRDFNVSPQLCFTVKYLNVYSNDCCKLCAFIHKAQNLKPKASSFMKAC